MVDSGVDWWSLSTGGRCGQVVADDRWSLLTGGRCGQVVAVDRWSSWTGGRRRQVVVVDRWPFVGSFIQVSLRWHSNDCINILVMYVIVV